MRVCLFVVIVLLAPSAVLAHDMGDACARNPEVEYVRWRARLCDTARNYELEAQRYYVNTSYLAIYGTPRLRVVPSRMIEPNLPVPSAR